MGLHIHCIMYIQIILKSNLMGFKNVVITQRQTAPCGLYRQCLYDDNSNTKMYIALIFIHYNTIY